jgi:hypothetical protein
VDDERFLAVTAAAAMSTAAAGRMLIPGAVFAACIVAGISHMTLTISCFIPVEVGKCVLTAIWQRTRVTMMRVEAVIDVTVKAVMAMEPGTSSDKDSADEPIRPVVAIGGAAIGLVVEVAVRANGRRPDADGDLSPRCGDTAHECNREGGISKRLPWGHSSSSITSAKV